MRSRLVVAVLALFAGAAWPIVVGAAPVDDVAAALRSDPVYVDAAAERALSESEAAEVRDAIGLAGTPIYVAVLPASAVDAAGGDAGELASQLASALQRDGTIAVLAGDSLRAGSSELPAGRAGELAVEALDAGGGDTAAVLVDFVELVGAEAASGSSERAPAGSRPVTTVAGATPGCFRRCWSAGSALAAHCCCGRRGDARLSGSGPRRPIASCSGPSCRCSPTTSCGSSRSSAASRCAVRLRRRGQPLPGCAGRDRPCRRAGRSGAGATGG